MSVRFPPPTGQPQKPTKQAYQSFAQLLDSVNPNRAKSQPQGNALSRPKPAGAPPSCEASSASNASKQPSTNFGAGIKRRADGPPLESATKLVRKDAPSSSAPISSAKISSPANTMNDARPLPSVTPASAPKPSPAPNSYTAMLARAKEAQANAARQSAEKIQHKPTQKLSQREQMERTKALKEARLAAKRGKPFPQRTLHSTRPGAAVKPGVGKATATGVKGKHGEPEKPKKVRVDLGYSGTARPKTPAQPPRSAPSSTNQPTSSKTATKRSSDVNRYRYISDDEEEEEDESDDIGDDSEDMETGGGYAELMAEEDFSLRSAKKEDAAAKAEEEALRRQKLQRKRQAEANGTVAKKR